MSEAGALPARYAVLGLEVDALDEAGAVSNLLAWVDSGARSYACFVNVHAVVEHLRDESLRPVYAQAGLCLPDGMPIVWLGRWAGRSVGRVYGPDLTLALCAQGAPRGLSVYCYGGAPGVPQSLGQALVTRFPGLRLAGAESPPFRPVTVEEDAEAMARINASGADVVLVGLGCPRQERWLAEHRSLLTAPVLLGVGAAFDFHTGRVRQAPRWMMSAGLEWLFRLWQEPRRLWRRYLVYNPLFIGHVLLERLGRRYPR